MWTRGELKQKSIPEGMLSMAMSALVTKISPRLLRTTLGLSTHWRIVLNQTASACSVAWCFGVEK